MTLSGLVRTTGLPKTTVHRLLGTLAKLGCVERTAGDTYALTQRVQQLANGVVHPNDVRHLAQPSMQRLADVTGASVVLNTIEDDDRVCLYAIDTASHAAITNVPGEHNPLGLGSAALVLMSFQTENIRRKLVVTAARGANMRPKELRAILATVRKQGYIVSHGGVVPGFTGISAPILDAEGCAHYCVTIRLPTEEAEGRIAKLVKLLLQTVEQVRHRLELAGQDA